VQVRGLIFDVNPSSAELFVDGNSAMHGPDDTKARYHEQAAVACLNLIRSPTIPV
jgi:hypothetical protein